MINNPSVDTAASSEPVTLAEARLHVRADGTLDDAALSDMITAARIYAERVTGKRFVTQTLLYKLDCFPEWEIALPEAQPLASVTSVKYYDEDGVLQTLSSSLYRVLTSRAAIEPALDESWPATYPVSEAVEIRYVVGNAVASVPATIKRGILQLVGHWYVNREEVGPGLSEVPFAARALFKSDRTGEYV